MVCFLQKKKHSHVDNLRQMSEEGRDIRFVSYYFDQHSDAIIRSYSQKTVLHWSYINIPHDTVTRTAIYLCDTHPSYLQSLSLSYIL
jgi:hypothetical protein